MRDEAVDDVKQEVGTSEAGGISGSHPFTVSANDLQSVYNRTWTQTWGSCAGIGSASRTRRESISRIARTDEGRDTSSWLE